MNFETVEQRGRVYVVKNGVESELSIEQVDGGVWAIFQPAIIRTRQTQAEAVAFAAEAMGDWYTAAGAADRLVELGAFEKAPTPHDICMWARLGLLPGAVKIQGKGGAGQGGAWRIPEGGLVEFAKRREQR